MTTKKKSRTAAAQKTFVDRNSNKPEPTAGRFSLTNRLWLLSYRLEEARQRYASRRQLVRQLAASVLLVPLRLVGVAR